MLRKPDNQVGQHRLNRERADEVIPQRRIYRDHHETVAQILLVSQAHADVLDVFIKALVESRFLYDAVHAVQQGTKLIGWIGRIFAEAVMVIRGIGHNNPAPLVEVIDVFHVEVVGVMLHVLPGQRVPVCFRYDLTREPALGHIVFIQELVEIVALLPIGVQRLHRRVGMLVHGFEIVGHVRKDQGIPAHAEHHDAGKRCVADQLQTQALDGFPTTVRHEGNPFDEQPHQDHKDEGKGQRVSDDVRGPLQNGNPADNVGVPVVHYAADQRHPQIVDEIPEGMDSVDGQLVGLHNSEGQLQIFWLCPAIDGADGDNLVLRDLIKGLKETAHIIFIRVGKNAACLLIDDKHEPVASDLQLRDPIHPGEGIAGDLLQRCLIRQRKVRLGEDIVAQKLFPALRHLRVGFPQGLLVLFQLRQKLGHLDHGPVDLRLQTGGVILVEQRYGQDEHQNGRKEQYRIKTELAPKDLPFVFFLRVVFLRITFHEMITSSVVNSGPADVSAVAETQEQTGQRSEQDEENAVAHALAKGLGKLDALDDVEHKSRDGGHAGNRGEGRARLLHAADIARDADAHEIDKAHEF